MRAGWWWVTSAVLALGTCACADVEAGVTAGTAAPSAPTVPSTAASAVTSTAASTVTSTVTSIMPTVTATLPTIAPSASGAPATVVAATTPPPLLPPPCDPAALAFVSSTPAGGELIVTITNRGDARCEANLSQSPGVDPRMEPDVWLDAGAGAELVVAIATRICIAPIDIDTIDLVVNGGQVAVPIAPMRVCILSLTALFPV